jgi:serine/threonine protein kinase
MSIYCPNYRCHLQQNKSDLCISCGTPLNINGHSVTYNLTKILQDSGGKITDESIYCWYELFQLQSSNNENFVIKMLVIVPERLDLTNTTHVDKVKIRFEREYELLRKELQGVCKGYEILDVLIGTEKVRSIIMEEVSGQNLEKYVQKNNPIDSQRATRWMKQLATIVAGLHKNKIQHRDIKPTNIMVSGEGLAETLTLIDFGIALDTSNNQTTQHSGLGTDAYKDPQITDKYRDDSDLYSLGKTFIFLLTGQRPPYEEDWLWFDNNNITHPPVEQRLKTVIERMISPDLSKRFKNTKQLLKYIKNQHFPKWPNILLLMVLGFIISLTIYFWTHTLGVMQSKNVEKKYMHPICNFDPLYGAVVNCGQITPSQISRGRPEIFETAFLNLNDADSRKRGQAITTYEKELVSPTGKEIKGELLIYLNNARIQEKAYENSSQEVYTLIVSVPDYLEPPGATKNLLSGVAQAQKYFNENSIDLKFYVAILKEPPKHPKGKIEKIIAEVVKKANINHGRNSLQNTFQYPQEKAPNSKFIGVIGHYSSRVTFSVLGLYEKDKILLVSPSATRFDIPDKETTVENLEYFARLIHNGLGQVHEISNLLSYLAVDKSYKQNTKDFYCGLMNTTLIYEKGDPYAKSVGDKLISIFTPENMPMDKNISMESYDYNTELSDEETIKRKIIDLIKSNSKPNTIKKCEVAQTVIFIPGAYTTLNDPSKIVRYITENLPNKVNFIGNITVADTLSSEDFMKDIIKAKPDFYQRAYISAPYSILDFLPSYFTPNKPVINSALFKEMVDSEENILDIQWRKISGADSVLVFGEAIRQYKNNFETYKDKSITEAIHDIVKGKEFSAEGFFGKIEFDGYERKNIKQGTALKYIPYQDKENKYALVPLDYKDRNDLRKDVEKYKVLHFKDFVPSSP